MQKQWDVVIFSETCVYIGVLQFSSKNSGCSFLFDMLVTLYQKLVQARKAGEYYPELQQYADFVSLSFYSYVVHSLVRIYVCMKPVHVVAGHSSDKIAIQFWNLP